MIEESVCRDNNRRVRERSGNFVWDGMSRSVVKVVAGEERSFERSDGRDRDLKGLDGRLIGAIATFQVFCSCNCLFWLRAR